MADVFGDSAAFFGNNGNQNGDDKKKGFPVWGYIVLGALSTWLFTTLYKEYLAPNSKKPDSKHDSKSGSKTSGATKTYGRQPRKSAMKAPATSGDAAAAKKGAEEAIIPSSVMDQVEATASASNDGPDTGMEGYAPNECDTELVGASLDHAFKPFDDGEGAVAKPKSKVVVADSFNLPPHKNKNGMPAVTKEGLQEQKLRSLQKWSKQDRMPEFDRKYKNNNRSGRAPPNYKNRGQIGTGNCGKIDRDLFAVDPSTVYVDDSKFDSKFGKAYK